MRSVKYASIFAACATLELLLGYGACGCVGSDALPAATDNVTTPSCTTGSINDEAYCTGSCSVTQHFDAASCESDFHCTQYCTASTTKLTYNLYSKSVSCEEMMSMSGESCVCADPGDVSSGGWTITVSGATYYPDVTDSKSCFATEGDCNS